MSSSNTMTEEQLANMSDEDMMGLAFTPDLPEDTEVAEDTGSDQEEQVEDTGSTAEEEPAKQETEADKAEEGADDFEEGKADAEDDLDGSDVLGKGDDDLDDPAAGTKDPHAGADTSGSDPKAKASADGDKKPDADAKAATDDEKAEADKAEKDSAPVDYKSAYEKIMAPFKANGKEIKLNNPDEAVQLMQMGANYTKKLQALQPNLKMLKMLENNNLLDEGKLSYLIDLDKKDPKAIQRLLKDSGLDPLDIDTSAESDYQSGNYKVSDEEMTFNSTLEEVASNPVGKEIIVTINKTWDAKSKEALWTDPDIMRVMTAQKENGIYDRISAEVERRKTLGSIPNHTPFLAAYQAVGQEMQQQGAFDPTEPVVEQEKTPATPAKVVETRPAKPRAPANNDRVRAAAPARSNPGKAKETFNPLALSDEEFEKNAELAARL